MAEVEKKISVSVEIVEYPKPRRLEPYETTAPLSVKALRFRKPGATYQETITALRAALREAGFQQEDAREGGVE